MPEDVSQDDIDKLLEEALGGPTSSIKDDSDVEPPAGADESQDGIDALLADAMGGDGAAAEEPPESGAAEEDVAEQAQDDVDALLAGAETADTGVEAAEAEEVPMDTGGAQSQDDIDSLLSDITAGGGAEESAAEEAPVETGGAQSQDDIDSLLSGELSGGDEQPEEAAEELVADAGGPQSQDDIDSLLSDITSGGGEEETAAEAEEEPVDTGGAQSQDDIDSLLSGALGDEDAAGDEALDSHEQDDVDALLSGAGQETEADASDTGVAQGQDDIDSLLSGAIGDSDKDLPSEEAAAEEEASSGGQDDIDALLSGALGDDDAIADESDLKLPFEGSSSSETLIADQSSINEGLEDLIEESESQEEGEATAEEAEEETPSEEIAEDTVTEEEAPPEEVPEEMVEDVLGEEGAVTEEEPQEASDDVLGDILGDIGASDDIQDNEAQDEELDKTADLGLSGGLDDILAGGGDEQVTEDISDDDNLASSVGEAFDEVSSALESALKEPTDMHQKTQDDVLASSSGKTKDDFKIDISSIRDSLNLLQSGSEIEGITGEIASLLGQLSERARRYQSAYQGGSQEITDLRSRLRETEKRVTLLNSEKISLQEEMTLLRSRLASTEEEHVNYVEKSQSDIAALQIKVRERDNRTRQLESELESLNRELKSSHTAVANSDVDSRRAMFELERLKAEHDAERQERARLQRVLDMREQELQAIQARSAGEASSLFLDELHRLIRRLESELNVRTGAAREALNAIDMVGEQADMDAVMIARKNLLIASGVDEDSDALKELNRLERQPSGGRKVSGDFKAGDFAVSLDDFAADLGRLEMEEACLKAGRILAEKSAPPYAVMQRIYNTQPLRTEKAANHLVALIMLFQNIDKSQKSQDSSRGRENSDTEKTYVMMFDMLHYLVRIKAINKSTPEAWSFFLDVRGRYSFITSDAQWSAYRDKQLRN